MTTNPEFEAWLRQPVTEDECRMARSLTPEVAVEAWLIPLLQTRPEDVTRTDSGPRKRRPH